MGPMAELDDATLNGVHLCGCRAAGCPQGWRSVLALAESQTQPLSLVVYQQHLPLAAQVKMLGTLSQNEEF